MMKSPVKADFKGARFENYDKMYSTGTWSFPILSSLHIRPGYAVKSTLTESFWELQVRSCANGYHTQQGSHFEESFAPVAMIDSTLILLYMAAAQGKTVYVLDFRNALHTTVQFDTSNRTYNMLPSRVN
jgi:hypothetical protein